MRSGRRGCRPPGCHNFTRPAWRSLEVLGASTLPRTGKLFIGVRQLLGYWVMAYLAHQKPPPPPTLQKGYAQGPVVVLGGGGGGLRARYPCNLHPNHFPTRARGRDQQYPARPVPTSHCLFEVIRVVKVFFNLEGVYTYITSPRQPGGLSTSSSLATVIRVVKMYFDLMVASWLHQGYVYIPLGSTYSLAIYESCTDSLPLVAPTAWRSRST